jgi:flagellar hook-length control protein FliK
MAVSVIPTLASGTLPGKAAATSAGLDGGAGEFAALLSGELLGLIGTLDKNGKGLAASGAPDAAELQRIGVSDRIDDTAASAVDPSVLAAWLGQVASQTSERPGAASSSAPGDDRPEPGKATAVLARGRADLSAGERDRAPASPTDTTASFAKAAVAAVAANPAGAVRSPTANIAGETGHSETAPAVSTGLPASAAANAAANATAALPTAAPHSSIGAHLQSAAWPQQFGERVVWLTRNDQQSAQLTINPPQLGPIQITLNLSGDQASIAFASPHAEVRQAIENAMPHLKDMLSAAGIKLGQSNVCANLSQQRTDNPFADTNRNRLTDENAILPATDKTATTAGSPVLQRGRGLVDLFA